MKRDYKIDVYDSMLRVTDDKWLAKLDGDHPDHVAACHLLGYKKKWWVMIYLPEPDLRAACHESVHGAFDLLSQIGVNIDRENQEPLAWLADFIFSKCQLFIEVQNA